MPRLRVVGEATIVAVEGDQVTFDAPLPAGDWAYRGHAGGFEVGVVAGPAAVAGAPGFGFARVLVDEVGAEMVPHHRAVDVVSDNRLSPQGSFTTEHVFATTCPNPTVEARLVHRPLPLALAEERRWANDEQIMVEVAQ